MSNKQGFQHFKDSSPATAAIAGAFVASVFYFVLDHFNFASEYYAGVPPFLMILCCSFVASVLVFIFLKRVEPERQDSVLYALFLALGVGLASYSLIPRVNIATDTEGLNAYSYTLSSEYVWEANDKDSPDVHLYSDSSDYWNKYKPGDEYSFDLRKGGLGIWLVNMDEVFAAQKVFYDCDGYHECAGKGWDQTSMVGVPVNSLLAFFIFMVWLVIIALIVIYLWAERWPTYEGVLKNVEVYCVPVLSNTHYRCLVLYSYFVGDKEYESNKMYLFGDLAYRTEAEADVVAQQFLLGKIGVRVCPWYPSLSYLHSAPRLFWLLCACVVIVGLTYFSFRFLDPFF